MFTNKWDQLLLSASISRIHEPSPQGLISSKNINSNATSKNISSHLDPGEPRWLLYVSHLDLKSGTHFKTSDWLLTVSISSRENLCLALSRPKSMEHLYDEIIIGSLFPKRKKKIIVNHEPTKSLREIQNVNDSYKDR